MVPSRLEKLRQLMAKNGIRAYLVPSEDAHMSEYLPACWNRRAWLTGFDGSAGEAIITDTEAALWTDSRYFIQAADQLAGSGITLQKMGLSDTPTQMEWLRTELNPGDRVGVDARLVTYRRMTEWKESLARFDLELVSMDSNLVDRIWDEQPELPGDPIQIHPLEFAGVPVMEKLEMVRGALADAGAEACVLTSLDDVAWLFNIRGRDIPYNPVVIAYGVITGADAYLFVDPGKVNEAVHDTLRDQGVTIASYDGFEQELAGIVKGCRRVLVDGGSVNSRIVDRLSGMTEVLMGKSPVSLPKAIKNETELNGMRAAHLRDGVAMVTFLKWLEEAVPKGGVTEISAAEKLESFRARQARYVGPSFSTIAGYGPHGAIIHYSATPDSDVELQPAGVFLLDSGGQYLDGTTDITRTLALGPVDDRAKELYTRVLKGHLMLTMARFPEGTPGRQLDTIPRLPLWEIGEQYMHGTGHGVGAHLSVHEGPQAISYYRCTGVPLMKGMVQSNEPGYYEAGKYGFRIENLVAVVADEETSERDLRFFRFEDLTLCPMDRNLILPELLSERERSYLNRYHERVCESLTPLLETAEARWLANATRPI